MLARRAAWSPVAAEGHGRPKKTAKPSAKKSAGKADPQTAERAASRGTLSPVRSFFSSDPITAVMALAPAIAGLAAAGLFLFS